MALTTTAVPRFEEVTITHALGSTGGNGEQSDSDTRYKREYSAQATTLRRHGIGLDEYVRSRRITEEHGGQLPFAFAR